MVDEKLVTVAQLCKILENLSTSTEERVAGYANIVSHISKDVKYFVEEMARSAVLVWKRIQVDIRIEETNLVQSAVQALGYMLHSQEIVSSFSTNILLTILEDLITLLKNSKDKAVCARVLWCLSRQNIPTHILAEALEKIISNVKICITKKNLESLSVEFEALNVIKRMLTEFPEQMFLIHHDWFKFVYPFVVSKASKVADNALMIIEQNLQMLRKNSSKFLKSLTSDLKEGLTEQLNNLFSKKREIHVLRAWSCFITILDGVMHQGSQLTNSLLKIVEQGFKRNSTEVLIASYKAWISLMDNFANSKDALRPGNKLKMRLKLLLMPLVNFTVTKNRDANVEKARLEAWWHLVCILRDNLDEVFEQVVVPLLLYIFSDRQPERQNDELNLAKTPPHNDKDVVPQVATPRTPAADLFSSTIKTKAQSSAHFHSEELKHIGAEILYCLLNAEADKKVPITINEENLVFEKISVETFRSSSVHFFVALQDLTLSTSHAVEGQLLFAIWHSYCQYVTEIANSYEKEHLGVSFGGLLHSLERLTEISPEHARIALQIVINCYNDLRGISTNLKELLKNDSNPHGSFALHVFQLLLSENSYAYPKESHLKISDAKKRDRFIEGLIKDLLSGRTGQLLMCQKIITRVGNMASYLDVKDQLWRFWFITLDVLQRYLDRGNDINQGTYLEPDFTAIIDMLVFPIMHLYKADLPMAMSADIDASWEKLFLLFVRQSTLLATVDDNQAIEELCAKIDQEYKNFNLDLKHNLKFIGCLINIMTIITNRLEYVKGTGKEHHRMTPSKQNTPSKQRTPSKGDQMGNNLGNSKSLVIILLRILHSLSIAGNVEWDCKAMDQHIGRVLNIIQIFFSKIVGDVAIKEALKRLSNPLANLLTSLTSAQHPKVTNAVLNTKKSYMSRQLVMAGIVVEAIYTCVLEKYKGDYNDDMLQILTPLLKIVFMCEKGSICSLACNFWNKTFGKMQTLTYPGDLKKILLKVKKAAKTLIIPAEKSGELSQASEMSVLSNLSDIKTAPFVTKSPVRVHGSFLNKALSAEKLARSPSPRKKTASYSPMLKSPLDSARRKIPLAFDSNDGEFVPIEPSPKKRRILTEHQKEVMKLRSDVPVLYNELDQATQDGMISDDTQFTLDSFPTKDKKKISPSEDGIAHNAHEKSSSKVADLNESMESSASDTSATDLSESLSTFSSEVNDDMSTEQRAEGIYTQKSGTTIDTDTQISDTQMAAIKRSNVPDRKRLLNATDMVIQKPDTHKLDSRKSGTRKSEMEHTKELDCHKQGKARVTDSKKRKLKDSKESSISATTRSRTSPHVEEKSKKKAHEKSQKSRRELNLTKPKTRKSFPNTFQDFLAGLLQDHRTAQEKERTEEFEEEQLGSSVVPSSYTFSDASLPDQPLPFTFSTGSTFSNKGHKKPIDEAHHLETPVEEGTVKKSYLEPPSTSTEAVSTKDATDIGVQSNVEPSTTSLEIIPSSQPLKEDSPLLKGISMVTPRRSARRSKMSRKLEESAKAKVTRTDKASKNSPKKVNADAKLRSNASPKKLLVIHNGDVFAHINEKCSPSETQLEISAKSGTNNSQLAKDIDENDAVLEDSKNQLVSEIKEQRWDNDHQASGDSPKQVHPSKTSPFIDAVTKASDQPVSASQGGLDKCDLNVGVDRLILKRDTGSNEDKLTDQSTAPTDKMLSSLASDSLDSIKSADLMSNDGDEDFLLQNVWRDYTDDCDNGGKSGHGDDDHNLDDKKLQKESRPKRSEVEGERIEKTKAITAEIGNDINELAEDADEQINDQLAEVTKELSHNVSDKKGLRRSLRKRKSSSGSESKEDNIPSKRGRKSRTSTTKSDAHDPNIQMPIISLSESKSKTRSEMNEKLCKSVGEDSSDLNKRREDQMEGNGKDNDLFENLETTSNPVLQDTSNGNDVSCNQGNAAITAVVNGIGAEREIVLEQGVEERASNSEEECSQSLINNNDILAQPVSKNSEKSRSDRTRTKEVPIVVLDEELEIIERDEKISEGKDVKNRDSGIAAKNPDKKDDVKNNGSSLVARSSLANVFGNDEDERKTGSRPKAIDLTEHATESPTECPAYKKGVEPNSEIKINSNENEDTDSSFEESLSLATLKKRVVKANKTKTANDSLICNQMKDGVCVQEISGSKQSSCVPDNDLLSVVCQAELVETESETDLFIEDDLKSVDTIAESQDADSCCGPKKLPAPVLNTDAQVVQAETKYQNAAQDKQFHVISFAQPQKDCSSPLRGRQLSAVASPSISRRLAAAASPSVSPVSGILKKRLLKHDSPSPKSRRVTFAEPLEEQRSISHRNEQSTNADLAVPLPSNDEKELSMRRRNDTPRRLTSLKAKYTSPKMNSQNPGMPICSELIECSTPIEKLLPSLTSAAWSRGLGNIIRAQNIRTVGNLSALSEAQIECLPIRSPKVEVVKKVLRKFQSQKIKLEEKEKFRKVIPSTASPMSALTPTRQQGQVDQMNLKDTPSRKSITKPTSLFPDVADDMTVSKTLSDFLPLDPLKEEEEEIKVANDDTRFAILPASDNTPDENSVETSTKSTTATNETSGGHVTKAVSKENELKPESDSIAKGSSHTEMSTNGLNECKVVSKGNVLIPSSIEEGASLTTDAKANGEDRTKDLNVRSYAVEDDSLPHANEPVITFCKSGDDIIDLGNPNLVTKANEIKQLSEIRTSGESGIDRFPNTVVLEPVAQKSPTKSPLKTGCSVDMGDTAEGEKPEVIIIADTEESKRRINSVENTIMAEELEVITSPPTLCRRGGERTNNVENTATAEEPERIPSPPTLYRVGENRIERIEDSVTATDPTVRENNADGATVYVVSVSPLKSVGQKREIHYGLLRNSKAALAAGAQETDSGGNVTRSFSVDVENHAQGKEKHPAFNANNKRQEPETETSSMGDELKARPGTSSSSERPSHKGKVTTPASTTSFPSTSSKINSELSKLEELMTPGDLSQLSAHDCILIHDKLTNLGKRVLSSLTSKITGNAV